MHVHFFLSSISQMIIVTFDVPPGSNRFHSIEIQDPIESKYYDEFQKNGLENVIIRGDEDLKPIN